MKITIEIIPHEQQRLNALGDWFFTAPEDLTVRISDLGDWRFNFLAARHEMDEAMLCKLSGITTEMVDKDQTNAKDTDEPDSFIGYPGEWIMSRLLNVEWTEYGKAAKKVGKW